MGIERNNEYGIDPIHPYNNRLSTEKQFHVKPQEKYRDGRKDEYVLKNDKKTNTTPIKIDKVEERRGKAKDSKMILDLKNSPLGKKRQSRQTNHSNPFNQNDYRKRSSSNSNKEKSVSNPHRNSEKQMFFVKCSGDNCSKTNCHQPTNKSTKEEKGISKPLQMHETKRLTQLPPRPSRQSHSLVFLKDSPKTKRSLERCHSSSPSSTPSPSRKLPSNEKLHTMHLKVDELCYTSLPTFASPINT